MTELVFTKDQALEAIRIARNKGMDWLYENYPKPNGRKKPSSTGFLLYEGVAYPVKPLGRLANDLAGYPMEDNPITNAFRNRFKQLGFQLISSPQTEALLAEERQRRLAEVWCRPGQAKFRREVFELLGARCLVTGCETLLSLEAAHILPVQHGGSDTPYNGLPMRADIHRLFDAGALNVDPATLRISIGPQALSEYRKYHGIKCKAILIATSQLEKIRSSLRKRTEFVKWIDEIS